MRRVRVLFCSERFEENGGVVGSKKASSGVGRVRACVKFPLDDENEAHHSPPGNKVNPALYLFEGVGRSGAVPRGRKQSSTHGGEEARSSPQRTRTRLPPHARVREVRRVA